MVRALIETVAILYDTEKKLEKDIEEQNLDNINSIVSKKMFSNKLDKLISGVRKSYDILSEYTHPNYLGVFGSYARIDQSKIETNFSKNKHTQHNVYMCIQANLYLLNIAISSLNAGTAQIDKIAEIHELHDSSNPIN